MRVITLLFFLIPMLANAQIWIEDFDGSNGTNPFSYPCVIADSRDYFGEVCLDGGPCGSDDINADYHYLGAQGSFFGARDINGNSCGTNNPVTSSATGIDISSCGAGNTLYVCFDIAESDSQPREGTDTWDGNQGNPLNNSFITFSASIDGGATTDFISFAAVGNNNSGPALDADCDGTGEGSVVTSTFGTFCIEIPVLGSTMDLSFTIGGLNTDGDDLALDNIGVHCTNDPNTLGGPVFTSCNPFPIVGDPPLFKEDFDGSNVTNPPVFSESCSDDKDYFDIVCVNGGGCPNEISSDFVYNGAQGQFFGVRDSDADPCSTANPKTLSFNDIDISSCCDASTTLYVCFDVAESRNIGGAGNPEWGNTNNREDTWDGNSSVFFNASIDGDPFTPVTSLQANTNSDTRPGIDVNCDGRADDPGEPELTSTFTTYCFELPTSGNLLDLEIVVTDLNSEGEDVAIDNICVFCSASSASLPGNTLEACTPFISGLAVWYENFDGSNTTNPFNFPCVIQDSRDYFGIVCLAGGPCGSDDINSDYTYGGVDGSFFGARDMNWDAPNNIMEPCPSDDPETSTATGIDISSCASGTLYLCFDTAESDSQPREGSDTWDGNQSDPNSNSFVTWSASVDGGTSFDIVSFAAVANNNSGPAVDSDSDGTGEGALVTSTFTTFCAELPVIGSLLDLSFEIGGLNTDGDDVAIDNIGIFCTDDDTKLPEPLTQHSWMACAITATAATTPETCAGSNDGMITVTASAANCFGTLEYSLNGSPFQASNVFMSLMPGTYSIEIRCSATPSCTTTVSATIDPGQPVVITSIQATPESCPGANDGILTVIATGPGTLEYSINGGPFQSSNMFGGLAPATYNVVVQVQGNPVCSATGSGDVPAGVDATPPMLDCGATPFSFDNDPGLCEANLMLPPPLATDLCGIGSLTNDINGTGDASGVYPVGSTTVIWTATDVNGNSSTCSQEIIVNDVENPVVTCPADMLNLNCNIEPAAVAQDLAEFMAQGGSVVENCMVATFTGMETNNGANFCPNTPQRVLTRIYTATDDSGLIGTCEQTISFLNSTIGPVITSVPPDHTVNCSYNVAAQEVLFDADTDCFLGLTKTVSEVTVNGTPNCPNTTYQYTYTATDECGRTATHIQTYTIQNDPPEFVCPPDICIIDCPNDNDEIQAQFDAYADLATVNTSCSGDITITNNFNPNGFTNQNCNENPLNGVDQVIRWQVVTFTATDQCNRSTTCTALVVITDHTPPTISGSTFNAIRYNNAQAQSEYNAWIQDNLAQLSATDECTNSPTGNVTWSWSPASPNTVMNGPFATTLVTFTASDGCGNEAVIGGTFQLKEEPTANISGNIITEEGDDVEHVEVSINQVGIGQLGSLTTATDGQFIFPELGVSGAYDVIPYRNDDPLNGISTLDLIYISMHILGIDELDSPYQRIAADVNNNGAITSADLVELRKLILFITSEFENNTSWRFVDENFIFPDPTNPFASTFPEIVSFTGLTPDEIADFIAIKVGDVTGDANANDLQSGDTRTTGQLSLSTLNQYISKGNEYTMAIYAKDFVQLTGYQFTLNFDQNMVEFVDLHPGELSGISTDNFGLSLLDRGIITTSWHNRSAVDMSDESILFSITFKAKSSAYLKDAIQLTSLYTKAEAYSQTNELLEVTLEFGSDEIANPFLLYQNQPNPFKQETNIGFKLPEASKATLIIYDVSGRIIQQYTGDFSKGYNQILVSHADLNAAGLLYYRLQTETDSALRKMILME